MFQGLFFHVVFLVLVPLIFSRDPFVFVSCPSNIFKGSFSFLFLAPLQYFQGMPLSLCFFCVMFLFLAPLIFPRDAFRDYFLIRFLASQIFSRDAGVLLLPLLLLLQRLLLPLTTSATFVFSSFKWNLIFWILIGGGICKSSFWSE